MKCCSVMHLFQQKLFTGAINTRGARDVAQSIKFLLCKHDEYLSLDPSAHGKAGYPVHIYNPALGGSGKR